MMRAHSLPPNGPKREALREKGQFWTPEWIAEAMVGYVLLKGVSSIFDPAVGAGAFFKAAKAIGQELGKAPRLLGTEVDPAVFAEAYHNGLTKKDLELVQLRDFVLDPPRGPFEAIVANPPYIRHHRLSPEQKAKLREFCASLLHRILDGRAGLHIYFLLRALQLLAPGGRLAFLLPADTCEGVFAPFLWNWIIQHYRLDAVVTFAAEASPFPQLDTNPLIFLIQRTTPEREFFWVRCIRSGTSTLKQWVLTGFPNQSNPDLEIHLRKVDEGLRTGLSRPPADKDRLSGPCLGDYARVLRGIATGANHFFFLTRERAAQLGIPKDFLTPAIGRTRDVPGERVDEELLAQLNRAGRPTLLFCPDGRAWEQFPEAVQRYLREGMRLGLPQRPLLASRKPWYKMETRQPPPILFAYLGRRHARFVRNLAGVVPLTGFLCVYPHSENALFLERLWQVLSHPATLRNLTLVGKTYGSGCIKVEPRALERLPLPEPVVQETGLARFLPSTSKKGQLQLDWGE
jgi:adenine-specific DNA-methyltransferase